MTAAGTSTEERGRRNVGAQVVIRSARDGSDGGAFDLRWQAATMFFSAVILIAGVVAVWLFGYTFWAIFETVALALHLHRGESVLLHTGLRLIGMESQWQAGADGWPLDAALCLGLLSAIGILYLGFDRLGALGNRHTALVLLRKARTRLGWPVPGRTRGVGTRRFFIEIRHGRKNLPLPADIGWLFLFSDRLVFVGDGMEAEFPRTLIGGASSTVRGVGGLGGEWVEVPLTDPPAAVRLLPRDRVRRISDSGRLAPVLADALREWSLVRE